MNPEAFDVGMRLRAAHEARVQPRTAHTPYLRRAPRIAVTVDGDGTVTTRRDRGREASADGVDGLRLLAAVLPKTPDDPWHTLVVPTRSHLARLARLCHAHLEPGTALDAVGTLVDWWQQRAEHPGNQSVVVVVDACRQRWVTGGTPADENDLAHWYRWLRVRKSGTEALLAAADLVQDGTEHPLLANNVRDGHAWRLMRQRVDAGWDWRLPDSAAQAAIGLRARENAANLYERALLDDPAWERRQRHAGYVVTGTVRTMRGPRVVVAADTSCRHKEGREVLVTVTKDRHGGGASEQVRAVIHAIEVEPAADPDGPDRLVLDLAPSGRDARAAFGLVGPGDPVKVKPEAASPDRDERGERNLAFRYANRSPWATGRRGTPTEIRRDVPLDVVAAALPAEPS